MQSNDSDSNLDPKNDTLSLTSTDQIIDDKQQQQQQQNTQNNDKYNISNVLKHIYALKHVQKNNDNKCLLKFIFRFKV
jgi:hypothetical protein